VSRRTVALFAAATMTLGGVAFTYAVPAALALDVRFATARECTVGLLIGLTLAFLGNTTITALSAPRRRVSPGMAYAPDPSNTSFIQAVITGHGYFSVTPDVRDDLSVIFTYRPEHPYSLLMDITVADPDGFEESDSAVWEVSRETIHDVVMLGRSSGVGDFSASILGTRRVRLRVLDTASRDRDTYYDMYLSRAKLRSFLLRTMDAVPVGRESERLDIDAQLERLLA
jgi:hypothetical protein